MNGLLSNLATIKNAKTKRISSYDRTGGNADKIVIGPHETVTIADISGSGVINHIWITIEHKDPMYRRNMVIKMFWDANSKPAVEVPIGDFFGQGWGENYNYASLPLAAAPQEGQALVSYFPMPFATGAKIEIENESDYACLAFYYYIDYQEQSVASDQGYFHAFWNRTFNNPPQGDETEWNMNGVSSLNLTDKFNHKIVSTKGKGHYVGLNYFVDSSTPLWYGEGDDMWFIDGQSWPPALHGTGTEDYFNTAWGPKEKFAYPLYGAPRVNEGHSDWFGRTHVYRFHLDDPIYFETELKGSIELGHANCLATDVVTVAYWYQNECASLPPLPPASQRQNMPTIDTRDMHRWRTAFIELFGDQVVWGTEDLPESFQQNVAKKAREMPLSNQSARAAAAIEAELQVKMLNRRKN